jgi:hypothetical protein
LAVGIGYGESRRGSGEQQCGENYPFIHGSIPMAMAGVTVIAALEG